MDAVSLNAAYTQFRQSEMPVAVGIRVLAKAKGVAEEQGAQMIQMMQQMMQQSVQPHLGGKLDIRI